MARPSKPASVISIEGKSHRTKAELAVRREAEAALLTGKKIKEKPEVKSNQIAHAAFRHIVPLMRAIGKDDDLYGNTINRYCMLLAEEQEFFEKREAAYAAVCSLQDRMQDILDREEMTISEFYKTLNSLEGNMVAIDRQIQTKRKMLLDIEKESVLTVASSLRSIPKTPEKKSNALMEALLNG